MAISVRRWAEVPRWAAALAAASVATAGLSVACGAEPTNKSPAAQRAIVELGLRPAPDFDPKDPIVIESITNTSDRLPYYHHVPVAWYDRSQMGPHVRVDGVRPEEVEDPFGWAGADMLFGTRRELPPRRVREVVWRLRDQFQIPAQWTNLWVKTGEPHDARKVWIELDRAGRMVAQGIDGGQRESSETTNEASRAPCELIERIELPVETPDPKAQAAEKALLKRRIAVGAALGGVLALSGLGFLLWWRRSRRRAGGG